MIPEKYNELAKAIEEVIQFSQEYSFPLYGTADLITKWRKSKEKFYDLFGEKLIW